MSLIPGSIPITGFIAPTDTTDSYPVTDAIYGLDGLRNVYGYIDRDDIPLARRREGMLVGVMTDSTYWRLMASTGSNLWNVGSASNWEPFQVGGSGDGINIQYFISSDEKVIVATNSQYWVYGDLTIEGELENFGQVIITNGSLVLDGGTFSGMTGSLSFVTLFSGYAFATSSTINITNNGGTVSANLYVNSLTASHLSTVGGGATSGYVLSNDGLGNFTWIQPPSGVISRFDKNYIMSFNTSGNGQFSGLTISATPLNGCYVAVFLNGQEFDCGDGLTSSVSCYFSNDGGSTARDFSSNSVQVGDSLYWNGNYTGTDLYTSWRISLYYIV